MIISENISYLPLIVIQKFNVPGDYSGRATPVPISNTEVKSASAYGTAAIAVGESVVAGLKIKKSSAFRRGFF